MIEHPTELPPRAENALEGVPLGTCADGGGDAPSAPFYSQAPLAARRLGDWPTEGQLRARSRVRSVLHWAGEIIGCISLFAIYFLLLFLGEILR